MTAAKAPGNPPVEGCRIRLATLGRFDIEVDGSKIHFGRTSPRKPLALLQALLISPDRPLCVYRACDWLWPDADPHSAYRSLVTTTCRLRRWLQCADAVRFLPDGLALNADRVCVDAWQFERDLAGHTSQSQIDAALRLYSGAFLDGCNLPGVIEMRERLQRRYVRAVRTAADGSRRAGDHATALATYERALELVATDEDLHRDLMQLFIQQGNATAATATFQRCRHLLAARFGTSPSPATVLAFRSIGSPACDQRVTAVA